MEITIKQVAGMIDHTNLKPFATGNDFARLCAEAKKFGFKSVAINTYPVALCRKPLETTGRDEAALWGACILAAKGIGLADDLTAAAENQRRTGTRFEPDPEKHRIYTRLKEQYTRYEKSLSGLCHERLH